MRSARFLGIPKAALQRTMLVMLGSTLMIQGVTKAVRWIDTIYGDELSNSGVAWPESG